MKFHIYLISILLSGCVTAKDHGVGEKTMTWEELKVSPFLGPRAMSECFSTGELIIVLGGIRDDIELNPYSYDGAMLSSDLSRWNKIDFGGKIGGRNGAKSGLYKSEIFTFGGKLKDGSFPSVISVHSVHDNVTKTFEIEGLEGRFKHSVTVAGSNMYIFGGESKKTNEVLGVFDLEKKLGRVVELPSSIKSRVSHVAESNGRYFFVWGGFENNQKSDTGFVYDSNLDSWTILPPNSFLDPRSNSKSTTIGSKVFIWGGAGTRGNSNSGAWYDLQNRQWGPIGSIPDDRYAAVKNPSFTRLNNNEILLWGGRNGNEEFLDLGWVYNIRLNNWTPFLQNNSPKARMLHCMIKKENSLFLYGGIARSRGRFTHLAIPEVLQLPAENISTLNKVVLSK